MTDEELAMVEAINRARGEQGRAGLRWDERLARAARGHAEDMRRNPGMVHVGSDGRQGGERIRAAGYNWRKWGEIVGWGWAGDVGPMVDWWLGSGSHAPFLLDAEMVDVGVGYAQGLGPWGHYWTVNLARGDSGGYSEYYIPAVYAGGW